LTDSLKINSWRNYKQIALLKFKLYANLDKIGDCLVKSIYYADLVATRLWLKRKHGLQHCISLDNTAQQYS